MQTHPSDRRRSPRRKVLKSGYIAYRALGTTIDCVVVNLSEGGARLVVERPDGIPDAFELVFKKDGARRQCRMAWRDHRRVGVEFS